MTEPISIKPSEMQEGGAVPVDQNLRVEEARFTIFDYQGKAKPVTACKLVLISDDNVEHVQFWSVGDPGRFAPSADGKTLEAVDSAATAISKSSNFSILMAEMVNARFPENRLGADISVLEGLYAYWVGVPAPKRSGLVRTPEQQARGEQVILVPGTIHNLPGENPAKKAAAGKAATKAATKPAAPAGAEADITQLAVDFVGTCLEESGEEFISRQVVAAKVFSDLGSDPNRDAIATAIFSPAIMAALLAAGFSIDGENISR